MKRNYIYSSRPVKGYFGIRRLKVGVASVDDWVSGLFFGGAQLS